MQAKTTVRVFLNLIKIATIKPKHAGNNVRRATLIFCPVLFLLSPRPMSRIAWHFFSFPWIFNSVYQLHEVIGFIEEFFILYININLISHLSINFVIPIVPCYNPLYSFPSNFSPYTKLIMDVLRNYICFLFV